MPFIRDIPKVEAEKALRNYLRTLTREQQEAYTRAYLEIVETPEGAAWQFVLMFQPDSDVAGLPQAYSGIGIRYGFEPLPETLELASGGSLEAPRDRAATIA